MPIARRRFRNARLGWTPALILSASMLGGCYEHVVRAEGFRGKTVDVYEPNLKEPEDPTMRAIDEALWGSQETKKSTHRSRPR